MYPINQNEDKEVTDLKRLQRIVPNATEETFKVFKDCMDSDAVYKSALPYGIIGGIASHLILPKKWGTLKHVTTTLFGLSMYIFGKIKYSKVCYERAFGDLPKRRPRRNWPSNGPMVKEFDQEQQIRYIPDSENFIQEKLMDNTAFEFDSTANEFSSDLQQNTYQEEEITELPKQEKKRVTYDDLWMQHRDEQMRSSIRPRTAQVPSQRKKPEDDLDSFLESEDTRRF